MHKSDTEEYTITEENSYCPDYSNRKKEKENFRIAMEKEL